MAVGVAQPPSAVEQRTVNIEGNEPDRHTFILPCIRASQSYSYEACDEWVRAVLAAAAKQNYLKKPVLKSSAYANTQALLRRFIQDNFSAQVLSCEVLSEAEDGGFGPRWGVVLDQTLLYPTSGGQPHDLGKLGDANVVDVLDKDDRVIHVVDRPLPIGRTDGCVHWPRRFDHMQQHTGQHLLSAVFQERFGLVTVSFHLGETVGTIDLRGPQPSPLILEGAARAANAVVFEDREITVRYGTAEEFAAQGVRKEVDRKGVLRSIEITGLDLQPCGGTLRHTGQLGFILIRGCTKIRQDWRVGLFAVAALNPLRGEMPNSLPRSAHN